MSFKFAVNGIYYTLKNEINFRVQIVVALYVMLYMSYSDIAKTKVAIVFLCFAVVLSAELFNTSIERIVDYFCLEKSQKARIIKDVAAGAVLLSALGAVYVGVTLLWDKYTFISFVSMIIGSTTNIAFAIASVILSLLFVFKFGKVRK